MRFLHSLKSFRKRRIKRNELTTKTKIDFTIETNRKNRATLIFLKAAKIDRDKSYSQFKEKCTKSIADEKAIKSDVRVGTITGRGTGERLVSLMHKIAKEGSTIIIEQAFAEQIPIPPANIWWDPDEALKEAQRDRDKKS